MKENQTNQQQQQTQNNINNDKKGKTIPTNKTQTIKQNSKKQF